MVYCMVQHLLIIQTFTDKQNNMTKEEKKEYNRANYGFLQIKREEYELLKQHCKTNGFIMGTFVSNLIRREIKKK